jgi:hypothetical protein
MEVGGRNKRRFARRIGFYEVIKVNKTKVEIVERLLSYIESLPNGKETTTFKSIIYVYGKDCYSKGAFTIDEAIIDTIELMDIDHLVRTNSKKHGIILDSSKYEGMAIGLPFHIGFVVKRKDAKQMEIRDKRWWIDYISHVLEGSKFEIKNNPTENENCVIVVLKEEYREHKTKKDHFLAIKPYKKGGYSAWMKMVVYEGAKNLHNLPPPTRIHSNMPHFTNLSDESLMFSIAKELVKMT